MVWQCVECSMYFFYTGAGRKTCARQSCLQTPGARPRGLWLTVRAPRTGKYIYHGAYLKYSRHAGWHNCLVLKNFLAPDDGRKMLDWYTCPTMKKIRSRDGVFLHCVLAFSHVLHNNWIRNLQECPTLKKCNNKGFIPILWGIEKSVEEKDYFVGRRPGNFSVV